MIWLILLVLIALAAYVAFSRKTKNNEIVIRIETTSSPISEGSTDERLGEEKDNWERFDFYSAKMLPGKGRYRINYEDQRGLKTEREIQVKRVYENAGQYAIDAHCFLRNAHRSFINERIQKAINIETGEIVENLASDAIAQYNDSGEGKVLAAIDKEWMGVAILAFVCRADGQMRKAERTIVAEYLKRRCSTVSLNDAELDSAIKSVGDPGHREFKRIVRDLKSAGDNERLRDLLDCANRIVGTQKSLAPMERAALEILAEAVS
jgi:hypothetical protein